MGVHDIHCRVCGTPASYICKEHEVGKAKGECEQDGIGTDSAKLDILVFAAATAPKQWQDVIAAAPSAIRRMQQTRSYDWGAWEYTPSLNYFRVAMDDGDVAGIWRVVRYTPGGEGTPIVDLELAADEVAWVMTSCVTCSEAFINPSAEFHLSSVCKEYLREISAHLEIDMLDDKAAMVEAIRQRVRA
jgi:hypothetical protein